MLVTLHNVQGFIVALRDGDWFPRWVADSNGGLGGPVFILYPPVFYYGAALSSMLVGSVVAGTKMWLILATLMSAVTGYLLARDWLGGGMPAALAAAAYVLLPYRALDLYQRAALSESTAFIFMPLILLFAGRCLRSAGWAAWCGLGAATAALACTHLPSLMIFGLLFIPWLVHEGWGRWAALWRTCAAMLLGFGMAAPVLMPALAEQAFIHSEWLRERPNGDFTLNFLFRDPLLPVLGIRDPVKPLVMASAHAQLLLSLLCGALAWQSDKLVRVLLAGALLAYLMQTALVEPLWRGIPHLATVQFPWRFQALQVLIGALLVGCAARVPAPRRAVAAVLVVGLCNVALAARFSMLRPFSVTEAVATSPRVRYWIEPVFTPVAYGPYRELWSGRARLPRPGWADGGGAVSVVARRTSHRVLRVNSPGGGTLKLDLFYFPGWTATVDGRSVPLETVPGEGLAAVKIPPGEHLVEMRFQDTRLRAAAGWIGLFAMLVLLGAGRYITRETGRVYRPVRSSKVDTLS